MTVVSKTFILSNLNRLILFKSDNGYETAEWARYGKGNLFESHLRLWHDEINFYEYKYIKIPLILTHFHAWLNSFLCFDCLHKQIC